MINELTADQISKISYYVKKYTDIGFCTNPANKTIAENAINSAYINTGLVAPKEIIWCNSPFEMFDLIVKTKQTVQLNNVYRNIYQSIKSSYNILRDGVGDIVFEEIHNKINKKVFDINYHNINDAIFNSININTHFYIYPYLNLYEGTNFGQHEANILSFYDYFATECGFDEIKQTIQPFIDIAINANWWYPCDDICFVSEKHNVLKLDSNNRLHCETGPALSYPDGYEIYAYHGVIVNSDIINHKVTLKQINKETNTEVKRVMIQCYPGGIVQWLHDSKAKVIHQCNDINTGMPLKLYKANRKNDTPIVMVCMSNKTKERDDNGRFIHKEYYIRVKPDITNALEAVAWHHNQTLEQYMLTQTGA